MKIEKPSWLFARTDDQETNLILFICFIDLSLKQEDCIDLASYRFSICQLGDFSPYVSILSADLKHLLDA